MELKPLMLKSEVRVVKKELLAIGRRVDKIRVLEWGSGGSTMYFTKFLRSKGLDYFWRSIEYNKNWFEKVKEEIGNDKNTEIVLIDVGNNFLRQRYQEMDKYIDYPRTIGEKYDLIIIDGRKRRRCLVEAKELLDKNGVIFLHDAQRKHYQNVFSLYEDKKFVSVCMIRITNNPVSFLVGKKSYLQTAFFTLTYKIFVLPWRFLSSHIKLKFRIYKESVICAKDINTKLKILFVFMLFIFKKLFGYMPFFTVLLRLKFGDRVMSTRDYKNGSAFYKAITGGKELEIFSNIYADKSHI